MNDQTTEEAAATARGLIIKEVLDATRVCDIWSMTRSPRMQRKVHHVAVGDGLFVRVEHVLPGIWACCPFCFPNGGGLSALTDDEVEQVVAHFKRIGKWRERKPRRPKALTRRQIREAMSRYPWLTAETL